MKAAWYERQGTARDVLTVGEMDAPRPLPGEVRIRIAASGVNPGDVKKRQDAFGANIKADIEVLAQGGSIATYASDVFTPEIPFWQLVFGNARIFFVGSDDVPVGAKVEAARAVNDVLEAGWDGLEIAEWLPLDEIARAHEAVEHPTKEGRVVVTI